jgi:hypothetical protein
MGSSPPLERSREGRRSREGGDHRILVSQSFAGRSTAAREHVTTLAGTGKQRDTKSMVSCMATKKVTVTIPEDLLDEIRAEAAERGLSAYVAEALRFKRDRDRLRELSDWLQEEHGPLTEEERIAAFEELEELDAEHERRRAAGTHGAGEAA